VRHANVVNLALERVDGSVFEFSSARGKALLVIAFMHDDLRSQATLREAEQVARRHADSLVVVGVCGNEGQGFQLRTMLEVFARVLDLRAIQLLVADAAVRDGTSPLGVIEHVPTAVLINRAGYTASTVVGTMDQRALEALVAPALPPTDTAR
jgi:hypothetical protein